MADETSPYDDRFSDEYDHVAGTRWARGYQFGVSEDGASFMLQIILPDGTPETFAFDSEMLPGMIDYAQETLAGLRRRMKKQ